MLATGAVSKFHRLDCDEIWHHYHGDTLNIYQIDSAGELTYTELGSIIEGKLPMVAVKAGNWFAAVLQNNSDYALIGCCTTPAFDAQANDIANENLIKKLPKHANIIRRLI